MEAICGNGIVELGEACDAGGESAACDANCTLAVCGDATLNVSSGEACDDGNVLDGDGCSSVCQVEAPAVCGNAIVEGGESCDDGNAIDGDGCTVLCEAELAVASISGPSAITGLGVASSAVCDTIAAFPLSPVTAAECVALVDQWAAQQEFYELTLTGEPGAGIEVYLSEQCTAGTHWAAEARNSFEQLLVANGFASALATLAADVAMPGFESLLSTLTTTVMPGTGQLTGTTTVPSGGTLISADATLPLTQSCLGPINLAAGGVFTVNTTDDSNDDVCNGTHCSLREAINAANARAGTDVIAFDLVGAGPHTIQPTAALPSLTDPVIIDGTTQAGYAGVPVIELDGSNAGVGSSGLTLSTSDSTVRGLVINRFSSSAGIALTGSAAVGNVIQGNYLGTDVTGTAPLPNRVGLGLAAGASNNLIGGTIGTSPSGPCTGACNLISGNQDQGLGIRGVSTADNIIQGNYVGTDVTGAGPLGNRWGIMLSDGAHDNTIGGTTASARNVISGNQQQGLLFVSGGGALPTDNLVQGNFIGTNNSGDDVVANGGTGITIRGTNNTIGGSSPGARNLVSGNIGHGIAIEVVSSTGNVVQGNYIGTNAVGNVAIMNSLDGIRVDNAPNNMIGGTTPGAGNLISGNQGIGGKHGIQLLGADTTNTVVQGNLIGLTAAGDSALPNSGSGIFINDSAGNTIGGTVVAAGNVVSGNTQNGILILGAGSNNNIVQSNYIGTDVTGTVALGNTVFGVNLALASNNTIGGNTPAARNVISGNSTGIRFSGAVNTGNVVQGNFIGTDKDGTGALGNAGDGIVFVGSANGNMIGGTTPGVGNVISGNGDRGIEFQASAGPNNRVEGNLIGIDVTGTSAIGNTSNGILVQANGMIIGGTVEGAGNVISGNASGITITNGASGNLVQGNFIGTDVTGDQVIPNTNDGISLINGASTNLIGGPNPGEGNIIGGNGRAGVAIFNGAVDNSVQGNTIGTNAKGASGLGNIFPGVLISVDSANNTIGPDNHIAFNGTNGVVLTADAGSGNSIQRNSIHDNGEFGIDLANDGITPNDEADSDAGPNQQQNFPVLSVASQSQGQTTVRGTLSSLPLTTYTIEFFGTESCDPAGAGEGGIFLGSDVIETDGKGEARFVTQVSGADPSGNAITATATAPDGSTSEFSACLQDSDDDGLADVVDLEPDGNSMTFSDGPVLGGSTFGEVLTSGNQQLMISADLGPTGIRLFTDPSGGGQEARVSVCTPNNLNESVLRLERDTEVTVRCGSVDLEVFTGNVNADIQLNGDPATLTVTQGSRAVVQPAAGTITARSTNTAPVMVAFVVNGQSATVELGAGNELTADPSEGTFTTPPTNSTPVVVVVGGKPVTVVPGENAKFVEIDIKPGSETNPINLGSNGKIPVAILSHATFDATTVDPLTVTLADAQVRVKGNGTAQTSEEDVNGDGRTDLVMHIDTEGLQLTGEATSATLEGHTTTGQLIKGTDVVTVVP